MLQELFVKIVSMSLTAIPIVLVVLIARVFLRSKPKIFSYILWGAVLFRLICPFAFEADFSFVPEKIANGEVISSYIEQYGSGVPEIETGAIINNEEIYQEGLVKKSVIPTLSIIWVSGIVVLTVYSMILLVHLKKKLVCSILVRENIYLVDHIETPFVLGLINPKIYLPSNVSEKEFEYIVLHEKYHIKRKDYLLKSLAFAVLCVHWFNPFVWLVFVLASADMEMSCDEAVLQSIGEPEKTEYAGSILRFSIGKQYMPATFLGFGEVSPKVRIKSVLKWKAPMVSVCVFTAILVTVLGLLCLLNPRQIIPLNLRYDLTEEAEAYSAFEESYGFLPAAFEDLPDDLKFEKMEIEEPKIRMQYKGKDDRRIELIIIIPGYGRGNEIVLVDGEFQISYELQTKDRLINVNQYRDVNTRKMIMCTLFVDDEYTKYYVLSYDIAPVEFDKIMQNIKFAEVQEK